jgi:phage replication-related protein YjqB (UPF0714/DUF867 family)
MPDLYANFAELKAAEEPSAYNISSQVVPYMRVLILCPHGGGIEAGSSELVDYISKKDGYSSYKFEGLLPTDNNRLHITSTNFDEPQALTISKNHWFTLSLHGYGGTTKHSYIGGADFDMLKRVEQELNNAGFSASSSDTPEGISGTDPRNICNRNLRGKGVQIEISTAQRQAFFANNDFSSSNRGNVSPEFIAYSEALLRAFTKAYKLAPKRVITNVKRLLPIGG